MRLSGVRMGLVLLGDSGMISIDWSQVAWNVVEGMFVIACLTCAVWLGVKYVSKIYTAIRDWGK